MLTVLRFPDVAPWEWALVEPVIAALSARHHVTVTDFDPMARRGRRMASEGPIWVISRDWRNALRLVEPSGFTSVFVSILEMGAPKRHLSTLFLKSFAERLPPGVRLLTFSPLNYRFFREMEGLGPELVESLALPLPQLPSVTPGTGKVIAGRVTVGTFAPFVPESNLHHLMAVAHYVCNANPQAYFRIAGSGRLYRHLRAVARELGLEDRVSIEEASGIGAVAGSEIFLYIPLRNDHFGPLLGAAAAGLPVLAAEVPGIAELISDGNDGYILPINETKPLGELVLRLIEAPGLRRTLGQRLAGKLSERLAMDRLIGQYESLFFVEGAGQASRAVA